MRLIHSTSEANMRCTHKFYIIGGVFMFETYDDIVSVYCCD